MIQIPLLVKVALVVCSLLSKNVKLRYTLENPTTYSMLNKSGALGSKCRVVVVVVVVSYY